MMVNTYTTRLTSYRTMVTQTRKRTEVTGPCTIGLSGGGSSEETSMEDS